MADLAASAIPGHTGGVVSEIHAFERVAVSRMCFRTAEGHSSAILRSGTEDINPHTADAKHRQSARLRGAIARLGGNVELPHH